MAKNCSFSSLFNLQSRSISVNFGHLWAKYQGYSLTCWPKIAHFHHFSICNQNQSISIVVSFGQNTKVIALLLAKIRSFSHFSICNQNQSMSMLVICGQNTKVIALLFGQKSLIFITFQSAIKINQFQFWSFWGKYQGYSLNFWPKMPIFITFQSAIKISILVIFGQNQGFSFTSNFVHHFSICNQNQSISILVSFGQTTKVIAFLFGRKVAHFHHFSICNQNQSISILVNVWPKYQGYSLTFWPKTAHFHHFSICNQGQ